MDKELMLKQKASLANARNQCMKTQVGQKRKGLKELMQIAGHLHLPVMSKVTGKLVGVGVFKLVQVKECESLDGQEFQDFCKWFYEMKGEEAKVIHKREKVMNEVMSQAQRAMTPVG
jgi:hypothetical protein